MTAWPRTLLRQSRSNNHQTHSINLKKINTMKKKNLNKWGKTLMVALMGIGMTTFTGCEKNPTGGGGSTSGDSWAHLINETPHQVQINGNTMRYGDHVYTLNGQINLNETNFQTPTAYVTFTNVPSGYTEFEAVYSNFLGKSLHGTAAMIPMAFEIYARDAALGERCLNLLCNSTSTVSGIVRQLKNKFNYSPYSPENDLYVQRFLPAATLKGAAFNNGYNPTEPYTVEMVRSANAPQETTITGYGTNYYLYILAPGGWDSFQRGVEVWQAMGSDMYKVFNCPSTYTQCKNIIGTWNGLK